MKRVVAALLLAAIASSALGQTAGAKVLRQPKPVYPEGASQGQRQGNVNLIGRIDAKGKVQDVRLVGATLEAFIDPAVAAVNAWELKPATRGGKPVEIAANIALRYRLEGAKHGVIPSPMLGDLAVFPADIKGKSTAPDGFPIHRGADPRVRVEAVLDVAPDPKPRNLPLSVEALSPKGKRLLLYEELLAVNANAKEVKIPFTALIAPDWEDGIWLMQFKVNNAEAGGGQFWLAGDPENFHFVLPGKAPQPAAAKAGTPPAPRPTPRARPKTTKS